MIQGTNSNRKKLGIIGAGQLASMMCDVLHQWGIVPYVFGTSPDDPAGRKTPFFTSGDFHDLNHLADFFKDCQVVTLENEFLDPEHLDILFREKKLNIIPRPASFAAIDNKLKEKRLFQELNLPSSHFIYIDEWKPVDLERAKKVFGQDPVFVKCIKGAYDGKGTFKMNSVDEIAPLVKKGLKHFLIEEALEYQRELSLLLARNEEGICFYPLIETFQSNQICHWCQWAGPELDQFQVTLNHYGTIIAEAIDYQGLLCIEAFQVGEQILINEMAPRPHNSGHLTIEACQTSQFENHLRAVLNYPLGDTTPLFTAARMVNILGKANRPVAWDDQAIRAGMAKGICFHDYGKDKEKKARKMGHYTTLSKSEMPESSWNQLSDTIQYLKDEEV